MYNETCLNQKFEEPFTIYRLFSVWDLWGQKLKYLHIEVLLRAFENKKYIKRTLLILCDCS